MKALKRSRSRFTLFHYSICSSTVSPLNSGNGATNDACFLPDSDSELPSVFISITSDGSLQKVHLYENNDGTHFELAQNNSNP